MAQSPFSTTLNGQNNYYWGTAVPTAGTYLAGDILYNQTPTTNNIAFWICTVAGTPGTWAADGVALAPALLTTNGAVPVTASQTFIITKGSIYAGTLAAPASDGIVITIASSTAFAHTITATGLFQTGTANVNVATFANVAGAGFTVMSYNGKWIVTSATQITFS